MNAVAIQLIARLLPIVVVGAGGIYVFNKGKEIINDVSDSFGEKSDANYARKHWNEPSFQVAVQLQQYMANCEKDAVKDLLNRIDYNDFPAIARHYQKMYSSKYKANCSWFNSVEFPAGGNLIEHLQILLDDFNINMFYE